MALCIFESANLATSRFVRHAAGDESCRADLADEDREPSAGSPGVSAGVGNGRLREGDNPAFWRCHLDQLLQKPSWVQKVVRHPALLSDEMALAHSIGDKVEAAYRRGDLFETRVLLMRRAPDIAFRER